MPTPLSHWTGALRHAARLALALVLALPALAQAGPVQDAERDLQHGHIGKALRTLATHLEAHPADLEAAELQVDILLTIGQGAAAAQQWRERIRVEPENADAWYLLGRAELSPDAAEAAYQKALALAPAHAHAHAGLGAVQAATGRVTAAAESFQAALDAAPTLEEAWTGLIRARAMSGDRAAAESAARRAVEQVPGHNGAWLALAALVPNDAPNILTRAASRLPDDPQLQVALARALFTASEWDRADKAYERAFELVTQDDAQLRVERAMIAEIQGGRLSLDGATALLEIRPAAARDPAGALQLLGEVVSANPESGWARLVRGNVLAGQGRVADAERDLRSALVALPSSPEAWSAVGAFYLSQHRAAEAAPLLDKAAAARPNDPSVVVATAIARAELGEVERAETTLRKAMAQFPDSIGPTLALARMLLSTGRAEEAFGVLTEALRTTPEVNLAAALASAAREVGQPGRAVELMKQLAAETGDPRFSRVAEGLSRDPGNALPAGEDDPTKTPAP